MKVSIQSLILKKISQYFHKMAIKSERDQYLRGKIPMVFKKKPGKRGQRLILTI